MSVSVVSYAGPNSHNEAVQMDFARVPNSNTPSNSSAHRVKHLLQLNHVDYSILYNNHHFHNHTPHFLATAYLLGASAEQLDAIYNDAVSRDILESWAPSPHKITLINDGEYLGKGEYQRAWVDFFDDQTQGTDQWQRVAVRFLLESGPSDINKSTPLINHLVAGLGHPLIHLGYAFELNSREVAIEALSLAATCYDPQLASLLIEQTPSTSSPTSDLFEIFSRLHNDAALPTFAHPGSAHIDFIVANQQHLTSIMSYLNSWTISDPERQVLEAQQLASLILVSTSPQLGGHGYDFFLVHSLTAAHAVGTILPHLPTEHHATLLREWLLMTLLVYTAQKRPRLDPSYISDFELDGRDWGFVRSRALEGKHAGDAHVVKACHAMNAGAVASRGGRRDEWFLKSAVRFADEFDVWSGFDPAGEGAEEVRLLRLKDGIHV